MNRNRLNQTLGQAICCSIVFAIIVAVITALPRGDLFWEILKVGLLIMLALLNGVMVIGFTSLKNANTKAFYSFMIPIYPLYLASEELIFRWEWWHYVVMIISYGVCFRILVTCFENRTFTRSIESIGLVLSIFSTPYLYSALF